MIKQTITYDNFDGETETNDFYFQISKSELATMAIAAGDEDTGNFARKLSELAKSGDHAALIAKFKELIGQAYGIRTAAGGFKKSAQISEEFLESPAFDELLYMIFTDAGVASNFVNNLLPKSLTQQVAGVTAETLSKMTAVTNVELPEKDVDVSNLLKTATGSVVDNAQPVLPAAGPVLEEKPVIPEAFRNRIRQSETPPHEKMPKPAKGLADYTKDELAAMPQGEFDELIRSVRQ